MTGSALTVGSLTALDAYAETLPKSDTMPALFLGHGSPMNAIEENRFVVGLRDIAKTIPKPSAILCVSAHWFVKGTKVTAMNSPRTIHDFGGFPKELFQVQYSAPGSPDLAQATSTILAPTPVELDQTWGFDHGAWSVVKHLYPKADVPMIQLSVDKSLLPEAHFRLGQQLDALRDRGVLIVGSGNIVHNLSLVDFQNLHKPDHGFEWAREARGLVNHCIKSGDYKLLLNYNLQGRALQMAVPTPEHFLPLLYILGLKHDPSNHQLFNDEMVGGSLSMTSLRVS